MIAWMLTAAVAAAEPASPSAGVDALEQLQKVYQQSCVERAYGSYGDLCDQMKREIRAFARARAASERKARREPSAAVASTVASSAPPSLVAPSPGPSSASAALTDAPAPR